MVWGDQWLCPCGTHNFFMRTKCRDCGEVGLPDEKLEPWHVVMDRAAKADARPLIHVQRGEKLR